MKRSGPPRRKAGLSRKKPLSTPSPPRTAPLPGKSGGNRSPLRRTPSGPRELEPGEAEWKGPHSGACAVCGTRGRLVWHHVVDKQTLRKLGLPRYKDQRNALPIGAPFVWGGSCRCHDEHENIGINDRRIPYAKVPQAARDYAVEVLGEGPASEYFRRSYR